MYKRTRNRPNSMDMLNSLPPIIKDNEIYENKRDVEIQSNIKIKSETKLK